MTENTHVEKVGWQLLFALWAFQAALAVFWLVALPSDGGELFGFSSARLVLLGTLLLLLLLCAGLSWKSRDAAWCVSIFRPALLDGFYLLALCLVIAAPLLILVLFMLGQDAGFVYSAYGTRLAPLTAWTALTGLEFCAFQVWRSAQALDALKRALHKLRRSLLVAWAALGIATVFVLFTRLGITPTNDGAFGSPPIPPMEWQVMLAIALGLAAMLAEARWRWFSSSSHPDRWIALAVYVFTILLWSSQPIQPGYFATPPRAPNFKIYPFSDGLIYDQYAQSVLIGGGMFYPAIPTRPLYVTFLAWLHFFAGQDYTRVILLQTLVLAAFPAVLYLLGRELGGRPLGLSLALVSALRDLTVNHATLIAQDYSYSKLFFSELPTALLLCLFTLLALRWARRRGPDWLPLAAGGVLGLAALIRLQSVVLLLAALPIALAVLWRQRRRWLSGAVLMVLGVALALIPWVWRNYHITGGLILDNPISQYMTMARRWSGSNGNEIIPYLPGENDAQYASRMTGLALASLRQDPGRILAGAANHFFNNEIGNLLSLPLRDSLRTPGELLWPQHPFWQTPFAHPGPLQLAWSAAYLLLFGLGVAVAWRKSGLTGLLPLVFSLVYNAWTALFLSSGDRFLVPIDWAAYLYHLLGLLTLGALALLGVQRAREKVSAWMETRYNGQDGHGRIVPVSWRRIVLTGSLILLLGASIPLTEMAFPQRYPALTQAQLAARTGLQAQPGEKLFYGRALYPRYYQSGEGEPGTSKLGYGQSDQARLVFYLLGPQNTLVIFPLPHAPNFFPNASDVYLAGTQRDGFVQAREVIVEKDGKSARFVP